jgi:hypothetical protein
VVLQPAIAGDPVAQLAIKQGDRNRSLFNSPAKLISIKCEIGNHGVNFTLSEMIGTVSLINYLVF